MAAKLHGVPNGETSNPWRYSVNFRPMFKKCSPSDFSVNSKQVT